MGRTVVRQQHGPDDDPRRNDGAGHGQEHYRDVRGPPVPARSGWPGRRRSRVAGPRRGGSVAGARPVPRPPRAPICRPRTRNSRPGLMTRFRGQARRPGPGRSRGHARRSPAGPSRVPAGPSRVPAGPSRIAARLSRVRAAPSRVRAGPSRVRGGPSRVPAELDISRSRLWLPVALALAVTGSLPVTLRPPVTRSLPVAGGVLWAAGIGMAAWLHVFLGIPGCLGPRVLTVPRVSRRRREPVAAVA